MIDSGSQTPATILHKAWGKLFLVAPDVGGQRDGLVNCFVSSWSVWCKTRGVWGRRDCAHLTFLVRDIHSPEDVKKKNLSITSKRQRFWESPLQWIFKGSSLQITTAQEEEEMQCSWALKEQRSSIMVKVCQQGNRLSDKEKRSRAGKGRRLTHVDCLQKRIKDHTYKACCADETCPRNKKVGMLK